MNLNPLKALLNPLEKLITEHGSAAIQTKHIALLKEQFSILQQEIVKLAAENTALQSKYQRLETENKALKDENIGLTKKIQIYEQKNKPFFHANLLWLPDDKQPYCPTCYDSDHKLLMHMHLWDSPYAASNGVIHTKPALKCPKCNHVADITKHPKK